MAEFTYHTLGSEIVQTTTLKQGGAGLQDVYEIPYMIDSGPAAGHTGTVTIAASALSEANVRAAIEAQASAVHQVATIKG